MQKAMILLLAAVMTLALAGAVQAKQLVVGVTVIGAHPALEADQKGFAQALEDAGLTVKFDLQNAQGDKSNASSIARKFKQDKVDLVHSIATPTSQAAVKVIKDIPIVYSSVTDPVDAGLVKAMAPSGTNVTGVSDLTPVTRQLELYTSMYPKAKRWGAIFNPGEANAVVINQIAKKAAAKLGLTWVEAEVSNSSQVPGAAQSLVGKVDAFYISTDNTVVPALAAVVKVGLAEKIPVFAADTSLVEQGAAVALGFNYFQVGYAAGRKAAKILTSQKTAGQIPSGYAEKLSLWLSPDNAGKQGLSLDFRFIRRAEKVIK